MAAFLDFLSSNELVITISLMVIIFILVMAIIIVDILSKKKDSSKDIEEEKYEDSIEISNIDANSNGLGMIADETALDKIDVEKVTKSLEKTNEIEEIKYVEEDEELEKTRALLELETLKRELAKIEQENEIETQEEVVNEVSKEENEEIVEDKVKEIASLDIEMLPNKEEPIDKVDNLKYENGVIEKAQDINIPTIEDEVNAFEASQEENAIISVEELEKASETITQEEIERYEDDGNEPISLKELEALYKSIEEPKEEVYEEQKTEKITLPDFDIKVKPAIEVYDSKEFKTAPVISPVYGLKTTEESIMLEQTANLDKLNEEIKKTNEFLLALKELRKNLE